jgi:microcompartment protein CcmL/EutN
LKRRAEQLRREKAAAAYQATDDREKVEEIRGMIENMKAGIIAALKAAASYDQVSAVRTMIDRYPDGLKWIVNTFETYEEKTNAKSYTSINAAERTYTELKKNLQKWQPAQAAAAEA